MEKKYILTDETKIVDGCTLHRIKAVRDFGNVKAGDLGGWIEKEDNLSHEELCWVFGNACVYGNSRIYGDAIVSGKAQVYGSTWVYRNARVCSNALVYGDAQVYGNAKVSGKSRVYGKAQVYGGARVYDDAGVYGNARIFGNADVSGNARVYGKAQVYDNAEVSGNARVYGDAQVYGKAQIKYSEYIDTPINIPRSDGYTFTLQQNGRIVAGCRDFSPEEADAHWGDPEHHLHEESVKIVECLRALFKARI